MRFCFLIPIPLSSMIIMIYMYFSCWIVPFLKSSLFYGNSFEAPFFGFFALDSLFSIFYSWIINICTFIKPFFYVNFRLFEIKFNSIYKNFRLSFRILQKANGLLLSKWSRKSTFLVSASNDKIWNAYDTTSIILKYCISISNLDCSIFA